MNILLDTHILIWALTNSSRLSEKARGLIADEQNQLFVSAVSIWEIGVKHALGRGNAPTFGATAAIDGCKRAGFRLIDLTAQQAAIASLLPGLHGDLFDRLLVAQALEVPYRLLTHDRRVAAYSDTTIID